MRKYLYTIVSIFSIAIVFGACGKDGNVFGDCYADHQTLRVLNNKTATVNWNGSSGYLAEEFTYDTRLIPCNLPKEFQVDKLVVKVSGNTKAIAYNTMDPCCTEGLEITGISLKEE